MAPSITKCATQHFAILFSEGYIKVLFVTETFPLDITALIILAVLLICGFLEPVDAIKGFSNPAVITIALLFILSHALQKSGVIEYLVVKLNELTETSKLLGLFVFLFYVIMKILQNHALPFLL